MRNLIFFKHFIFLNIATLQNNFFLVQLTIVKFYKYIKRFPNSSHSITKWRQGSPLKSLLREVFQKVTNLSNIENKQCLKRRLYQYIHIFTHNIYN